MNKYKKPIIDQELFVNNPLAGADFKIPIRKRIDTKIYTTSEGIKVPNEYEVEAEAITRLYKKSDNRQFAAKLSPGAKSLFLHLLFEAEYGKDYLWLNREQYMQENLVKSINTYKAAVAELCRYLVIYPSLVKEVYWINPRLFFCGSRVKKYPKHVVVLSESLIESTVTLVKLRAI